jgi:hypothetical protein
VLIASVELLPSAFAVLCYMLDAELFPQNQLIPHGEHFVSIMKNLSSAFVYISQSTQSASPIITIDSGVWLTQ